MKKPGPHRRTTPSPQGLLYPRRTGESVSVLSRTVRGGTRRSGLHEGETLRAILESVNEGLLVMDPKGRVLETNTRALTMFGLARRDILGVSFDGDLSAPGTPAEELRGTWEDVLGGTDRSFPWKGRRPGDRGVFDIEVSLHRLTMGRKHMVLATIQDVSLRKKSELEALQVQRMKVLRSVIGGIAHEFDGIVNNVLGYTFMLRKYADDGDRTRRYRSFIEDSAKRGTELADRLLALAAEVPAARGRVHLAELLRSVAEEFGSSLRDGVFFRVEATAEPPEVVGDEKALRRAVVLLLESARASVAGAPAGRIVLDIRHVPMGSPDAPSTLQRFPAVVAIDVSHNGDWERDELREGRGESFVPGEGGRPGLALSVAEIQTTAWNHDGDITFSESVTGDAMMTLWLPLRDTRGEERAERSASERKGRGQETVLLVEHEDDLRAQGCDILERSGYRILTAADGQEAVDLFRMHSPEIDLVILDLVTPHLDGGQAYLELKTLRPDVPVLFCLGQAADQVVTSLLNEQGLRTIRKPFEEQTLRTAVQELLDRSLAESPFWEVHGR
jgi:PAS domain S-box-containing protein